MSEVDDEDILEPGSFFKDRKLDNGMVITLQKMFGKNWRVSVGDGVSIWANFCYHHKDRAIECWRTWDGMGDPPEGWFKHIETNRIRMDYTIESEQIGYPKP